MAKSRKKKSPPPTKSDSNGSNEPRKSEGGVEDEIDFPTVVWSLAILIVLVVIHRLIWGG